MVRGFPKISIRLQYGWFGCGIGFLVVVGTSREGRGGREGGSEKQFKKKQTTVR